MLCALQVIVDYILTFYKNNFLKLMLFQYGHRKLKMDFSRITILSVYYISTRCEKAKEGLRKNEKITCNSIILVTLSSRVK